MSLHRAEKVPDWENVPKAERNIWQKIAARTKGVVTPGNIVSVTGGVFVGAGLRDIHRGRKTRGTVLLGLGRLLDLADGTVAELTSTKSPVGEGIDAALDKAEIAVALPILVGKDMLPMERAVSIGIQNLATAALTGLAKLRGAEIHPNRSGKDWTMGTWMAVGSHCVEGAARDSNRGTGGLEAMAALSADIFFNAASGLNVNATRNYARDAVAPVA